MRLRLSTQANIILSPLGIRFHSCTQELVSMFSSNKFFLFIINLSILGFSQVGFSLRPKQVLKHLGHTQHLPTPPINNTTILFAILIGKESASLEYLIDTILKIEFQQIYLAHHQQLRILS